MFMSKEKFSNGINLDNITSIKTPNYNKFIDTLVPETLTFDNITQDESFTGTPINEITYVNSSRFPIAVEETTDWFNTQPMITPESRLGTDNGIDLTTNKCLC